MQDNILNQNITALGGIGPKRAEFFRTLGVSTVNDLLHFYPRTYENRKNVKKIAELKDGDTVCVRARAVSPIRENYIWLIRLRSISADSPNAKANTLL